MRKLSLLAVFIAAAAGVACEPALPATPSYATHVVPVLEAHCVRCHGAGGTLSGEATSPLGAPSLCYLDLFEDEPAGCSAAGGLPPACKWAAKTCAALFPGFLPTMPPPPAELNDWERELLTNWAKNPLP